ncbi:MAG: ABC transporter substrate-binding protein [Anaerolineaceae bacterium]|nr:ABC transporter substrate-binding protein [Anaerolineaceae bacterium]
MENRHIRKYLTLGVLISILGLLLVAPLVQAQTQPVFRIGVLDDERGPISSGARLAVQEINAAGGVRGADGTFFQLELIIQPTNEGATLTQAIKNLNQASVVAVLGPKTSDEVLNGLTALQSLNVPILTPATGDTLITADSTGRLFRIRAAEVLLGRALANYLVNSLGLRRIATAQLELDIASTAGVIGFSTAAQSLGVLPQPSLQLPPGGDMIQIVNNLLQANPEIVVTYGSPALAAEFYTDLRSAGWQGSFAYNQADNADFYEAIPFDQLRGIIYATSWPFTLPDEASSTFLTDYVRTFGRVPGPVDAASYDGVHMLAQAIQLPGELRTNLRQLDNVNGIQGLLRPVQLSPGESSNNVSVVEDGAFGAPQVVARYVGSQQIEVASVPSGPTAPLATPVPAATATPEGVVLTIKSARQNVRSGPSTSYDVIGQLSAGDQVRIIGATVDFSWVVIEFRGQQGWLATYLLDVFGDLNTVPIVTPPPTPTPSPTPTAQPESDIVIDAVVASPSPIIVNQPFTVSVTVRNAGGLGAGQFAVAATFPPNNVYSAAVVPGLAPGQSTVVNLTGTFTNTGAYSVVIVADLNNDVSEGGNGENNNLYTFNYVINKPVLRQGSQILNPGDTIDLEGNAVQGDANWRGDASALDALFSAKLGVIPNVTLDTVHWDLISPSIINQTSIPRALLNPGTIVGIITADGNRGVLRVDSLPGNQIALTYLLYQN